MNAIQVKNLHFGYDKTLVLNNINMTIPMGSIYGFLGVNGAGKSTTIRNILGLLSPQQGQVKVLDDVLNNSNSKRYSKVGSLIESPSLYPHLSGLENLKLLSKYQNLRNKNLDELLSKVGLLKSKNKKVKNYSTGMKQRLGLAIALIHDPQILILDEPTNGLDPAGIQEIRSILKSLKEEGKTIMLSSHLLNEVEKIASHVGIINDGSMQFEGTINSLTQLREQQEKVKIICSDSQKAQDLLKANNPFLDNNKHLIVDSKSKQDNANIIKTLFQNNIDIYEVITLQSDLENIFINMTQNKND